MTDVVCQQCGAAYRREAGLVGRAVCADCLSRHVVKYQTALKALVGCVGKVVAANTAIQAAATGLAGSQWQAVRVTGVGPPAAAERTVTTPPAVKIDGLGWPDAAALHRALADCRAARTEADALWDAIPQHDRIGLQPPQAYVPATLSPVSGDRK